MEQRPLDGRHPTRAQHDDREPDEARDSDGGNSPGRLSVHRHSFYTIVTVVMNETGRSGEEAPTGARVSDPERARLRHRALADPSRARILAEIADHGPLDSRAIAERVSLHPNTVRSHLAALAEAGLVASERLPAEGRGRPRHAYRSTGDEQTELRRYRLLAEILTTLVARSGTAAAPELEEIGELWGHHLVDSPPPLATVDADDALERVVDLLDESGFSPRVERTHRELRILMEPCPFLELARRHPEVVCPIHLGIVRGALAELGGALTATRLEPFVTPDLCVVHLAGRGAPPSRGRRDRSA